MIANPDAAKRGGMAGGERRYPMEPPSSQAGARERTSRHRQKADSVNAEMGRNAPRCQHAQMGTLSGAHTG
jgi:hypothetical protein